MTTTILAEQYKVQYGRVDSINGITKEIRDIRSNMLLKPVYTTPLVRCCVAPMKMLSFTADNNGLGISKSYNGDCIISQFAINVSSNFDPS